MTNLDTIIALDSMKRVIGLESHELYPMAKKFFNDLLIQCASDRVYNKDLIFHDFTFFVCSQGIKHITP